MVDVDAALLGSLAASPYGWVMSALEAELLNLLETSASRWTTLKIEGRTWIDIEVQNLAWAAHWDRMKANGASFAMLRNSKSGNNAATETANMVQPREMQETWRLWASPQKRRAQFVVGDDIVDVVIEGSTFWSNGHGRSITNGGKKNFGHGQGDVQNLIETAEYAQLLHVAEISEGIMFGRRTIDAKVTILEEEGHIRGRGVHGLTIGDPEFIELSVDRERGVVLSASSWFNSAPYRIVEMTKCEFDHVFARDVFEIKPDFSGRMDDCVRTSLLLRRQCSPLRE
jgi:hypothetical protein